MIYKNALMKFLAILNKINKLKTLLRICYISIFLVGTGGVFNLQAQALSDSTGTSHPTHQLHKRSSWFLNLPGGGRIWANENPSMGRPVLNISASSRAALQNGWLLEGITFHGYANYARFIERAEILIYRQNDRAMNNPLVTLPVNPGLSMKTHWDGQLPKGHGLRQGGAIVYVMRAYGPNGAIDETYPRQINLLSPQQLKSQQAGAQQNRLTNNDINEENQFSKLENQDVAKSIFGQSNLRIQNIPIVGSTIRIQGQDIPVKYDQLKINGRPVPINKDQRFSADYLLPSGKHYFNIQLSGAEQPVERTVAVESSPNHFFMVGIADLTVSQNGLHGNLKPIDGNENFEEDILVEGRMAFYLKGKVKGKYLITAHADTREEELKHMFDGFFGKNPQDLFRRINPDRYYPVYGDDGTTYRDINTQGKFYVRVNWDKSEVLWGNYNTRFAGSEITRYQRGLYGGALRYNSQSNTDWGESKLRLSAFGSDAQTVPGYNEFVSTGASVYYLRHTDVLPGSEQITIELRNQATGLTKQHIILKPDVDYEIDYLQGRIILKRPVAQIVRDQDFGIIRDTPQSNLRNVVLANYEYIPSGLQTENITAGTKGKFWVGDHVGVGATYVNEGRGSAEDYQLGGGNVTLRADRGTYIKVSAAQTDRTQSPVFFSDNGGMTFTETIPDGIAASRSGEAYVIEGEANLGTIFGSDSSAYWQQNKWNIGSWWKQRDSGFSVNRQDYSYDVTEVGAEVDGTIGEHLQLRGRISKQELSNYPGASIGSPYPVSGGQNLSQAQLIGDYRFNDYHKVTTEARQVRETFGGTNGEAFLAALGYERRFDNGLELYGIGQTDVWSNNDYRDNHRLIGGAQYLWKNRTTLGGEYSHGSRGDAFSVNASHDFTQNYTLYGRYGWSPDYNNNTLFGPTQQDGFSVGQRWQATNQLNIFHETQQIQSGTNTGLGHNIGVNYVPMEDWRLGLRLGGARLQAQAGRVDRRSATLTAGFRDGKTNLSSKFEYRGDYGAEKRIQLVTTQRIRHKINDSWRVAGRFNFADTDDKVTENADARFLEGNGGVSWRPWNATRWALLGKITYLYDRQSIGQVQQQAANVVARTGSSFDQQSLVGAIEGTYQLYKRLSLTAKGAIRQGEIRNRQSSGNRQWFTSTTQFAALQLRYQVWHRWDVLTEGRWRRNVQADDGRQGFLVGINRHITDFLQIGAGYNFTAFSDRLTDLDYNDRGWFINIIGIY